MKNKEHLKYNKRSKEMQKRIINKVRQERQRVFDRFSLLFTLLGTFGLVATFYGFEHLIDRVATFSDNPFIFSGSRYSDTSLYWFFV